MRILLTTVTLGSLLTSACGSNNNEAAGTSSSLPTTLSSGLPANSTMNTLTPTEAKQFCAGAQQWAATSPVQSQAVELGCLVQGLAAAAGPSMLGGLGVSATDVAAPPAAGSEPASCKLAYDSCKQKQTQGAGLMDSLTNNCTVAADCTATVAEVETCLNSLSGKLDGLTQSVPSCTAITSKGATDSLMTLLTFYSQMTSGDCAPLATKCASMNPLTSVVAAPRSN